MVQLQERDSHHSSVQLPTCINNYNEAMVANVVDRSTEFLADTGASHHIACKREFFMELTPLKETAFPDLCNNSARGFADATHDTSAQQKQQATNGATAVPDRSTNVAQTETENAHKADSENGHEAEKDDGN